MLVSFLADAGNFLISGSVDFNREFIYTQQRLICLFRCAGLSNHHVILWSMLTAILLTAILFVL